MGLTWNISDLDTDFAWNEVTEEAEIESIRRGNGHSWCEEDGKVFVLNTGVQALIGATMDLGLPRITERNWQAFFVRLRAMELLLGPRVSSGLIEAETVRKCIGLKTNANPKTEAVFRRELMMAHGMRCVPLTILEGENS